MPEGAHGRRLASVLTEVQMLWHVHPVNRIRHAAGRREANALWVWGGGCLPAPPALGNCPHLLGNAPEIAGLALWLGLDRKPLVSPSACADPHSCIVIIERGEERVGEEWLARLGAAGSAFDLLVDEVVLSVPARRSLMRRDRG